MNGYGFLPKAFSLKAYEFIFLQSKSLIRAYGVTIFVTVVGTFLSMMVTMTFAYVLSRKDFVFHKSANFFVFFTILFSGGTVPTYMLMVNGLHLKNNIFALMLPYLVMTFNVILMRNYFSGTPTALIESAKIDGASEIGILFKIILPISLPGMGTVGLLYLLTYWNDWYQALLYIDDPNMQPLQQMLQRMMSIAELMNSNTSGMLTAAQVPAETARMAMCIMAIGPIVLVFPFVQKFMVQGLTMGSVKG